MPLREQIARQDQAIRDAPQAYPHALRTRERWHVGLNRAVLALLGILAVEVWSGRYVVAVATVIGAFLLYFGPVSIAYMRSLIRAGDKDESHKNESLLALAEKATFAWIEGRE